MRLVNFEIRAEKVIIGLNAFMYGLELNQVLRDDLMTMNQTKSKVLNLGACCRRKHMDHP